MREVPNQPGVKPYYKKRDLAPFVEPTDPLCPVPTCTRHKRATCWPNPRKMGQSGPTHRRNVRMCRTAKSGD